MADKLLTIVIPVRSEEETIRNTIAHLAKTVRTPHRIIIADDTVDPLDRTIDLLCHPGLDPGSRPNQKRLDSCVCRNDIFVCKKTKGDQDGFGPALVRAVKKVRTLYTVFLMADSSDDPKTIDRMMTVIQKESPDVVVGCRYMKGAKKIGGPWLQGVLSTLLNAFLFCVAGYPTQDATNACKMYKTSFLKSILPRRPKTGVEFSFQLTTEAVFHRARMLDVPTVWHGRKKGQSKVRLFSRGPVFIQLAAGGLMRRFRTISG